MNWSYLHFKNHVNDNLYNDVNKAFLKYEKKKRGGPLFFKLLVDILLSSNETSLLSLESTIKNFNIAKDGMDDIPETIKTLEAGSLTIRAMRDDGSERSPLPEKFVIDLSKVFQTTSVPLFNRIPVIRYFRDTRYIFTSKFTSKKHAVKKIFFLKTACRTSAYSS
jgi:hypothetical protein